MKTMPIDSSKFSRREFLRRTALGAGALGAAPAILPARVFGATAPSNTVNVAHIGVGTRGSSLFGESTHTAGARVVAICDPCNTNSYGCNGYDN
jgi:hypothetical protein